MKLCLCGFNREHPSFIIMYERCSSNMIVYDKKLFIYFVFGVAWFNAKLLESFITSYGVVLTLTTNNLGGKIKIMNFHL